MTIVTRAFEKKKKKSCGICDNDFSALPENISHDLVAIVTKDFARFKKKSCGISDKDFSSLWICLKRSSGSDQKGQKQNLEA